MDTRRYTPPPSIEKLTVPCDADLQHMSPAQLADALAETYTLMRDARNYLLIAENRCRRLTAAIVQQQGTDKWKALAKRLYKFARKGKENLEVRVCYPLTFTRNWRVTLTWRSFHRRIGRN
jgi:hypothetical protein